MNANRYSLYWIPLVFASGIFVSCRNDIEEIRALTDDRDIAVQTVINGTYYYTEHGELTNRLEAGHLDRYEGDAPRIEVRDGFFLTIYDSTGGVDATLQARFGTFWDMDRKLVAREKVKLHNSDGSVLVTEELYFVQDSDLVYTDKHVAITTEDGSTIYGKGLVSDSKFKKRKIKQATGQIYIEMEDDSTATD